MPPYKPIIHIALIRIQSFETIKMKAIIIYYSQTGNTKKIAEAKKRFRRLVPLKDAGWKMYWCAVKKHPRLKPL